MARYPETVFALVGEGKTNEIEILKKQCIKDGTNKSVIFTGFRADLKNIYSGIDLFLMTSTAEGLPNTVLEAMSMEIPIVSTSVDGVPEIVVDGQTGFLCEIANVEGLAEKTMELMKNSELRKRFSSAARERIEEKFSFDKRLEIIEKYYLNLICDNT